MDVKKIGEAIRHLRIKEGFTQKDIAEYLDISFQAVSKWERGLCVPDAAYLVKLAEYLNVELDDLLEGNIKYLDDEWCGWLVLPDCDYLTIGYKPLIEVLLGYFMLAGIKEITVQGSHSVLEQVMRHIPDGNIYGLQIRYTCKREKIDFGDRNVMIIKEAIFLYGANLTKYFWRAMTRRNGVSVLTVEQKNGESKDRIAYNKQKVARKSKSGNCYMLPVYFVPTRFVKLYCHGMLINEKVLFAEPTARGLVNSVVNSESDLQDIEVFIKVVENMTGEKVYDLIEIEKVRHLKEIN